MIMWRRWEIFDFPDEGGHIASFLTKKGIFLSVYKSWN